MIWIHPETCSGCPLDKLGRGYAPADGTATNAVLLLGEALGEQEVFASKPFVGAAGGILRQALDVAGLRREQFLVDNCIRCQPPGNKLKGAPYEQGAIAHCCQYWTESAAKARVIVALGNIPAEVAAGVTVDAKHEHRHYVYQTEYGLVLPTFHPAYIVRGKQSLIGLLVWALLHAVELAQKGLTLDKEEYEEAPTPLDLRDFVEALAVQHPDVPLAFDIETLDAGKDADEDLTDPSWTILSCSLSFDGVRAISFPWTEEYIPYAQRALASDRTKIGWNSRKFDVPRLQRANAPLGGFHFDAMEGWKTLQMGLPRDIKPNRLGFVAPFYCATEPWKHLGPTRPAFYACKDAAVTWRVGTGIIRDLRAKGCWDAFVRDQELWPLLERLELNGILIDKERQDRLRTELLAAEVAADEALQRLVPLECKPLHPKGGYKKPNKRIMAQIEAKPSTYTKIHVDLGEGTCEERWARVDPFLANSSKQIMAYMRHRRHPVPSNKRNGSDTTEEDQLRRMAKRFKDPVYEAILAYREAHKISSTYLYTPDADGRVRTHFFVQGTGRIGSHDPNLQNVPKRQQTAAALRRCFVAKPGHVLIEADWSAIEAVLVGYFAGDDAYVALAKRGVHTFLASHVMGKPLALDASPAEFKATKRAAQAQRNAAGEPLYDSCKRVVHGTGYRMGPRLMHMTYPESFPSEASAKALQDMYLGMFPKVREWQSRVIAQAHAQHYLRNPFGFLLWFWDVKHWDSRRGGVVEGEDAKSAVAFLPQSTAAGIIRRTLMALRSYVEGGQLVLIVHDSALFEVPRADAARVAAEVRQVMTAPIPELESLTIGVEAKMGPCWWDEDMEEV